MGKRNVKIKRSKMRLYRKRKSTARKVVDVLVLVVIIGGLGLLGYSAAGPLIDYLSGETRQEISDTPWTPPETTPTESADTTPDTEQSPDTTAAPPNEAAAGAMFALSESALESSQALSAELKTAADNGFETVLVPLKNDAGYLLYRSQIDEIKDTELVIGTMPLGQINSIISAAGLSSAAVIPTLLDSTSPSFVDDCGIRFADDSYGWLDNTVEAGGKRWLDPFRAGTSAYFGLLAAEIKAGGFDALLLSDLRFPTFYPYDESILNAQFFTTTRYTALVDVFNSAAASGPEQTAPLVSLADLLAGYGSTFPRTAEILSDRSFSGTIYVEFTASDFGNTLQISENETLTLPGETSAKAAALFERAAQYAGDRVTIIPIISLAGLSPAVAASCYTAISE